MKAVKRKQTEDKQKRLKANVYAEEDSKQLEAKMEQLFLDEELEEASLSDEKRMGN